ncbi:MAG: GyrI-like domain-containing protein, partial [Candidatus Bathyarchaeota archaeon]|nr:GyrI-like domain-containing protein [Candidatus Bathyarchaeota archaeon]
MNFLMIDGVGNPNTAHEYKDAVEALYSVSYALKFMVKRGELGIDYGVMPLEGLWWADDMSQFSVDNKDIWKRTSMIMQPEYVTKGV